MDTHVWEFGPIKNCLVVALIAYSEVEPLWLMCLFNAVRNCGAQLWVAVRGYGNEYFGTHGVGRVQLFDRGP